MIKIMTVDDEPNICEHISLFFGRIGYSVISVTDPRGAMKVIEQEMPQLILLDIVMSDVGGYDILKSVKEKFPRIKVVMVSALANEESKEKAFFMGADEYVTKPFTDEYLEEVVMKKISELLCQVRILIVDDDEVTCEGVKSILMRSFNCDVDTVFTGEQALVHLLAHRGMYDVVLMDIKMPGKSGKDVLREIKQKRPYLPDIIIVTGYDSNNIVEPLLTEGALDYLPKPVDMDILRKRIKSLLLEKGKFIEAVDD